MSSRKLCRHTRTLSQEEKASVCCVRRLQPKLYFKQLRHILTKLPVIDSSSRHQTPPLHAESSPVCCLRATVLSCLCMLKKLLLTHPSQVKIAALLALLACLAQYAQTLHDLEAMSWRITAFRGEHTQASSKLYVRKHQASSFHPGAEANGDAHEVFQLPTVLRYTTAKIKLRQQPVTPAYKGSRLGGSEPGRARVDRCVVSATTHEASTTRALDVVDAATELPTVRNVRPPCRILARAGKHPACSPYAIWTRSTAR